MIRSTVIALAFLLGTAGLAFGSHYPIDGIPELIPAADAAKLKAAGITTTEALLAKGATAKARKALAKSSQVTEKRLRQFIDAADLMRVAGIGPKMVRLLGVVKVHTQAQLKRQVAAKLAAAVERAKPKLAADLKEKLPDKVTLGDWIAQAKKLPAAVK
jgi:predicted flap endonuclease-1-like 5' DNA nuclease